MSSSSQLAAALDKRDQRIYKRLLLNRFFRGTVTGVNLRASPCTVSIQRTGETTPDGGTYAVGSNWYYPLVGDDVELVWRDQASAWVAWPRIPAGRTASKLYRVTGLSPSTNVFNILGMDTLLFDNLNISDLVTRDGFVIQRPGFYRVSGRASLAASSTTRVITAIYQNGAISGRGFDCTSDGGGGGGVAQVTAEAAVGDYFQLAMYPTTSGVGIETGEALCFLEIEWVP